MRIVTVSDRGQIALPADIRKQLGIEVKDLLSVTVENGKIVLEAVDVVPRSSLQELQHKKTTKKHAPKN